MSRTKKAAMLKNRAKKKPLVILCTVCGKGDGKYKCPKCRAPFCCVQCSKAHKEKCPAASSNIKTETTATDGAASTTTNDKSQSEQSKYLSHKELNKANNQPPRKKRTRRDNKDDESDDSNDDEPGWNMTPEMKKIIHQSTWLRKELQDGGLRQLIGQIDTASDDEEDDNDNNGNNGNNGNGDYNNYKKKISARNNGNVTISARELAVARTKHSHPKFASFVDQLLLTAGVLQPSATDGGGGGGGGHGDSTIFDILEGRENNNGQLVLAPTPRRGGAIDDDAEVESSSDESGSSDDDDSSSSDEDSEDDDGSGSAGESKGGN